MNSYRLLIVYQVVSVCLISVFSGSVSCFSRSACTNRNVLVRAVFLSARFVLVIISLVITLTL